MSQGELHRSPVSRPGPRGQTGRHIHQTPPGSVEGDFYHWRKGISAAGCVCQNSRSRLMLITHMLG